ncbi:MAG: hypothetical protein WD739_10920 [Actinomycetota bacterium]
MTNYALDRFLAPDVSKFTSAEIPDMSDHDTQSGHWLVNYVLSSILRGSFRPPQNAIVYNFLRRAEGAFSEHANAREQTLQFLDSGRQSVSLYSTALRHWEFFLSQAWQGIELLRRFPEENFTAPYPVFQQRDGSVEQRLNALYNSMKHVESRIVAGQIPEGATTPVWLANEGIRTTDEILTFEDTGVILRDLAEYSDLVVDPRTMGDKARAREEDQSPSR